MKNVYHEPGPPASGHLVFSAHSRSLPHLSVKSREQTQSKLSLLQKTPFVFFRKQCLVTHSKSCAPCLGFKDLYQRMGSFPFHLNISLVPPGPEASLDLCPHWYCSIANSCLTLCDYMYGRKTGFLVFHYFAEFP